MQLKARSLKRQLRATARALSRCRFPITRPLDEPPAAIAPLPVAVVEAAAPAVPQLNAADVGGLVAKAPVLVELQYEVLDLRHEIDALKHELAALRTKGSQQPAELKTSQLSIVDATGRVIAGISSEGVVSCRLIEMHPGKS